MTFAIRWGSLDDSGEDSNFIYFDAITSSTQSFRGQVTKHPVDNGGNITDHYIRENPIFQFTGIITGTDISSSSFLIKDEQGKGAYNAKQEPFSISVSNGGSNLLQYLPASISQFFSKQESNILIDTTPRTDLTYEVAVRNMIVKLVKGVSYNSQTQKLENRIQLVDLYEFDDTNLRRITNNLVITSFSVNETPESGDALMVDITLEQVEFVTLKKEALPENVKKEIEIQAAAEKSKGKQDSTTKDVASGGSESSSDVGAGEPLTDAYYDETSSFSRHINGVGQYGGNAWQ